MGHDTEQAVCEEGCFLSLEIIVLCSSQKALEFFFAHFWDPFEVPGHQSNLHRIGQYITLNIWKVVVYTTLTLKW